MFYFKESYIKSKMFSIEASNPVLQLEKILPLVKAISTRFEPLKSPLDKEKLERAYSSSPLLLAWWDVFRTFEWEKAFPDSLVSVREIQELLILV